MTVPPVQQVGYGPAAVTPHHLATVVALRIMQAGGNAADGAVAANAVLGVVAPETCGIGGDLFALVHRPGWARPEALNASGRAGSGCDFRALLEAGHSSVPLTHPASVTAPGCVDGWVSLLDRFGVMDLETLLEPAIGYAEAGFAASVELSRALVRRFDQMRGQSGAAALLPGGRPPSPGDRLVRSDLGATLRQIAEGGRSAFYEGPAGRAISEATGHMLTAADLERPHADWVEALGLDLYGRTAWTVPPNSQGYLTLAAGWLFSRLDPPASAEHPEFVHLMVESFRAAASERDDLVADPGFSPISASELVSPDRLASLLPGVKRDARATWVQPAAAPGGTAYLCCVDGDGMGVSLIQSNFTGLGSGIAAEGSGVLLHNRGAGFNLIEGHPNQLEPGKRPLHTLSPTLWTEEGRLSLLLGTRGGHQQPQFLLQAMAQLFHLGKEPAEAQAAPRWALDDRLAVEATMPDPVVAGLRSRGHTVEVRPALQSGWGPLSIITVDQEGQRIAAADPRVATATALVA